MKADQEAYLEAVARINAEGSTPLNYLIGGFAVAFYGALALVAVGLLAWGIALLAGWLLP